MYPFANGVKTRYRKERSVKRL